MNTYADDPGTLLEHLDIKNAVLVGHSTGGGEVVRYVGRWGTARVAKVVLVSAVPPVMLQSDGNPGGTLMSVFDGLRTGIAANRSAFYRDLALPFYGYNRPGAAISQATVDGFWFESMRGSLRAHYECITQFSETDFTEDLKRIDVPTLVMHGDADEIVPIAGASLKTAKTVAEAVLTIYPGAPHGLCTTMAETVNADLLNFVGLAPMIARSA
jgi:non-heme chloroperoxidase